VGKSSLLLRFVDNTFEENLAPTVGVDFKVKLFETEKAGKVKLTLWDTAGQERFRTLTSSYYRGAQGVILVYDVTRQDSFDHVQHWLNEVEAHLSGSQVIKLLVGNKIDKNPRVVQRTQGEAWARSHQMLFVETSAREDIGVTAAFSELVNKILESPTLLSSAKVGPRRQLKDTRGLASGSDPPSCAC